MARYIFTFGLILAAALSRLLPHPMNVAPITALALFGGVYLGKRQAFIIPIAAMLLSDFFLGFYSGMTWVYGSFIAIVGIGLWLKSQQGIASTFFSSIVGSILFFIVTNFGVWISSQVSYPHNFAGLMECYTAAIPFFRNTLVGDLAYVAGLFGLFELINKFVPDLQLKPISIK